jgi:hypothetical protein
MRDRGVSISLGKGCIVRPDRDIRDMAGDFDIFQELGAERINTVSMDPDLGRSLDQFGVLAEMSALMGRPLDEDARTRAVACGAIVREVGWAPQK